MANRKVSLITTALNESGSIEHFIDSIEKQVLAPTEVIIVDAGSGDNTVGVIENYLAKNNIKKSKYKIVLKSKATRSEGRNIAISKANYAIIAVTDVGCRLKEDWLKELVKPFDNKETDAVAGFYLPVVNSAFQEALSAFVCSPLKKVKPGFLPSSRSVAFRKDVWLKVHGYPDELNYCEDLVFDRKVIKAGYKFIVAPRAVVYWPQRENPYQAFKQFYHYAYGDGQVLFSNLQTHSRKVLLLYIRYSLFVICFLFFSVEPRLLPIVVIIYCLYLCRPILVYQSQIKSFKAFLWVPIIKLIADVAVMAGSFIGILKGRK